MRAATITVFLSAAVSSILSAQANVPLSDPLAGRLVFEAKGCLRCHALDGFGGDEGPDFAREQFFGNSATLASVMWNHIPQMNRRYRSLDLPRPSLSVSEMRELMGFLYYLRYLGQPGSALRGKELVAEKGCNSCHTDRGELSGASDLRDLELDMSPVNLVQAMWNHGPAMEREVESRGMEYPMLGPDDIGDISAYLQLAVGRTAQTGMAPGKPSEGKKVFETKGCTVCHSVDGEYTKKGPDFQSLDLKRSVTQIAGVMWNHAPVMSAYMEEKQMDWPQFAGNEMADLVAFLYFIGFQDEAGDSVAGRQVFQKKGCADCHESTNGLAPDLTSMKRPESVIALASRMWNHAPEMEDLVLMRNMTWPRISGPDMQNLFGYLRTHMKARD